MECIALSPVNQIHQIWRGGRARALNPLGCIKKRFVFNKPRWSRNCAPFSQPCKLHYNVHRDAEKSAIIMWCFSFWMCAHCSASICSNHLSSCLCQQLHERYKWITRATVCQLKNFHLIFASLAVSRSSYLFYSIRRFVCTAIKMRRLFIYLQKFHFFVTQRKINLPQRHLPNIFMTCRNGVEC